MGEFQFQFEKLKVWQEARELVALVYQLLERFPRNENYVLCDQLRRAAISVPSNIAEGAGRPTDADFAHFLDQSLGSANEVETQLLIAKNLKYITEDHYNILLSKLIGIQKQLTGLISSIRRQS